VLHLKGRKYPQEFYNSALRRIFEHNNAGKKKKIKMSNFIISSLHKILLNWSNQGGGYWQGR
jgi:hypothetical protein